MPEFIDTHNHIIPGIDDGSPDLETSLAMARIAVDDGISTIVATPHIIEGVFEGHDLGDRISSFQRELDERGIALRIVPGAEVPMSICMTGEKELLRPLSIGGRYLLMESAETTFEQMRQAVYRVRLSGLYPVLAHPERTSYAREDPGRLGDLVDREDVYCQVTVASLEGLFGPSVKKVSRNLLKAGVVHLVASDAHSAGKRAPRLSASYWTIGHLAGAAAAGIMTCENPRRLVDGLELVPAISRESRRQAGFLSRLRKGR